MFSSRAIILFGGMTKAGNLIQTHQRAYGEKPAPIFQNKVKTDLQQLKEPCPFGQRTGMGYEMRGEANK